MLTGELLDHVSVRVPDRMLDYVLTLASTALEGHENSERTHYDYSCHA